MMRVIEAKIQTVEDIYRMVWTAIATKRPVEAIYLEHPRQFCPHRLGRNSAGQLRVLGYQYGGQSRSGLEAAGSPDNWRCMVLERLKSVRLLDNLWQTAPNHSRPATCVVEADIDVDDPPQSY